MRNKAPYKYKTSFISPYKNIQTWTNGTVTLRVGVVYKEGKYMPCQAFKNRKKIIDYLIQIPK